MTVNVLILPIDILYNLILTKHLCNYGKITGLTPYESIYPTNVQYKFATQLNSNIFVTYHKYWFILA